MFADCLRAAYCEGKLIVYEVDRGAAGITLGIQSKFPRALLVTVDCAESANVQSHTGNLKADLTLGPGDCVVAHHLGPVDAAETWSWSFSLNARMAP